MSDNVPDLDTDKVSWVAYYDVTEHTNLNGIEKPTQLDDNVDEVNNLEQYDDGVVLNYVGPTRDYTIRATTSGEITAHMEQKSEYSDLNDSTTDSSELNGTHDIVNWISPSNIDSNMNENVLERAIKNCLENIDEWDSDIENNYNSENVGLHNYKFEECEVSLFSQSLNNREDEYAILYAEETNIIDSIICVSSNDSSGNSRRKRVFVNNDNTVHDSNEDSTTAYSAVNLNDIIKPGERIQISNSFENGSFEYLTIHIIVLWN